MDYHEKPRKKHRSSAREREQECFGWIGYANAMGKHENNRLRVIPSEDNT